MIHRLGIHRKDHLLKEGKVDQDLDNFDHAPQTSHRDRKEEIEEEVGAHDSGHTDFHSRTYFINNGSFLRGWVLQGKRL